MDRPGQSLRMPRSAVVTLAAALYTMFERGPNPSSPRRSVGPTPL